jgi:hypothetical protein
MKFECAGAGRRVIKHPSRRCDLIAPPVAERCHLSFVHLGTFATVKRWNYTALY